MAMDDQNSCVAGNNRNVGKVLLLANCYLSWRFYKFVYSFNCNKICFQHAYKSHHWVERFWSLKKHKYDEVIIIVIIIIIKYLFSAR